MTSGHLMKEVTGYIYIDKRVGLWGHSELSSNLDETSHSRYKCGQLFEPQLPCL